MATATKTRLRWNTDALVWEFYVESWGGWCILRRGTDEASEPMTHEQGERYADRRRKGSHYHLVQYEDTKGEPRRAPVQR